MPYLKGAIVALLVTVTCVTPSVAVTKSDSTSRIGARRNVEIVKPVLTPTGYGAIRIGEKPSDVRGYTLKNEYGQDDECYIASVKEAPDLALLVTNGVIKRISIGEESSSSLKTDRGIGIGSTQAAVLKVYRPTAIRAHQYDDEPASYLTWLSPGSKFGVRFETGADRRVKVIHVGKMPELGYVERCG